MPRGNSASNTELVQCIEQARDLLDQALALVKKGGRAVTPSKKVSAARAKVSRGTIDFSMPIRAFIKKHSTGMNGAMKFTLLLAYLTKGNAGKRVTLAEIEKHWNKMTAKSLLGMKFNRLYSSQARENDWANTEKTRSYHLRPTWKEILQ